MTKSMGVADDRAEVSHHVFNTSFLLYTHPWYPAAGGCRHGDLFVNHICRFGKLIITNVS